MITTDILKRFELQVDDSSELSSSEELDLANEVYDEIQSERQWEWLNGEFNGYTSTSVDYVALPVDFRVMKVNSDGNAIVYVGTDLKEYMVIPYDQRRKYIDSDGYCYVDVPNKNLVFCKQPTEVLPVSYDYVIVAPALIFATSPIFREAFHKIIAYGMAWKFNPIELSDKATSYRSENQAQYFKILTDMQMEDTLLKLNLS